MIIPVILETDFEEIKRKITLVENTVKLVQIDFADGSLYRMARGKEDISGDYTRYDVRKSWRADGRRITTRGEKDAYRSIIWNDGTYTYAYLTDTPLNRAEATALATGR